MKEQYTEIYRVTQRTSPSHFTSFKKVQMQATPSLENKPSTQLIDAMSFVEEF